MGSKKIKNPYHPMTLFDLTGQNALVIGIGGLGSEAALGLAGAGAFVAAADINPASTKALADRIRRTGGNCQAYHVDVCRKESVADLIDAVVCTRGPIRTAVIASGITRRGLPEDFNESDWDQVIAVNLKGCFLCCQAVGRHMLTAGGGSIINFSSIAGQVGLKDSPAYAASKGGVDQLTRTLAIQWAAGGVRVNAIAPSFFETPMVTHNNSPDLEAMFKKRLELVPMQRMGKPSELVSAIVFLASPGASMVTGVILPIDGGYLAQ
jgi:NAD(P)-dependent dehydrogenase (short-subunit alcohol dehydrogenase family)